MNTYEVIEKSDLTPNQRLVYDKADFYLGYLYPHPDWENDKRVYFGARSLLNIPIYYITPWAGDQGLSAHMARTWSYRWEVVPAVACKNKTSIDVIKKFLFVLDENGRILEFKYPVIGSSGWLFSMVFLLKEINDIMEYIQRHYLESYRSSFGIGYTPDMVRTMGHVIVSRSSRLNYLLDNYSEEEVRVIVGACKVQ